MNDLLQLIPQKVRVLIILAMVLPLKVLSQDSIVNDKIYLKSIKSVQIYREGWPLSYPIIELFQEPGLVLKFDDLSDRIRNFNYKIVHCTSNWKPSSLNENEYIEGMMQDQIDNYSYSFNTYTNYVHYSLKIPNENISFRISGNYALIVFEDFDESRVVLVKRFMVAEKLVNVEADVSRPVLSMYRDNGHQINLSINYSSFPIEDPYSDIKVTISQNGRWDNPITTLKPLFDRNGLLMYDYQAENIFPGGNEFRWFDIKSLRYQSPYIKSIDFEAGEYFVTLFPEENRSGKVYFYEEDLNGRFFIEVQEESNNDTDGQYVWTDFRFPVKEPSVTGNYYIFGALTNWELSDWNRMSYDFESSSYILRLLLKQGYYNYQIAFVEEGVSFADLSYAEGNHYETENDYLIFIYHHGTTSRYERLIGYQIINSLRRK